MQHPALAESIAGCRIAIDQEFASPETSIEGHRELAAIPPVSGGHDGDVDRVRLEASPLDLATTVSLVEHPHAGGIATFTGNVRSRSRGQDISHLEYEAYPSMALRVMREIAQGIERELSATRVAIVHRIGRLEIGETAVIIAASAPHRAEAFAACRDAIEALKRDVPIWKKEVSTSGESWIGKGP